MVTTYARIECDERWPFGEPDKREPWVNMRWIGKAWWPVLISWEFETRGDLRRVWWPLLKVDMQYDTLCGVWMRRDGLLLVSACLYWLWLHPVRWLWWHAARELFRAARRLGYGYIEPGVMFRWRDLFVRQPQPNASEREEE